MLTEARWDAAEQDLDNVDLNENAMLTYGEFDLDHFYSILDVAVAASGKSTSSLTFADLGSGAGRLVLSAAARSNWKACVGVEVLPSLHQLAEKLHAAAQELAQSHDALLSPCRFEEVDLSSAGARDALSCVDVAFAFSTCFEDEVFAAALRRALPLGAIVVTIDAFLPNREPEAGEEGETHGFFVLREAVSSMGADSDGEASDGQTHTAPYTAYVWELRASRPAVSIDYALLS